LEKKTCTTTHYFHIKMVEGQCPVQENILHCTDIPYTTIADKQIIK